MADLRERLHKENGYPESWRPDVNDTLVGEFVEYRRARTRFGTSFIAVLEDEDSGRRVAVWLTRLSLREGFREKQPRRGERVGIKRLSDTSKGHHRYVVLIDREEREVVPDFFEGEGLTTNAPQVTSELDDGEIPF